MPRHKLFTPKEIIKRIGDVQSPKYDEDGKKIEEVQIEFNMLNMVVLASTLDSMNELVRLSEGKTLSEAVAFLLDLGAMAFIQMKE